jgi:hypothetical protein
MVGRQRGRDAEMTEQLVSLPGIFSSHQLDLTQECELLAQTYLRDYQSAWRQRIVLPSVFSPDCDSDFCKKLPE